MSARPDCRVRSMSFGDFANPRQPVDIRARLFAADGRPVGDEITISEGRIDNYSKPVVAMNANNSFAVAWRTVSLVEAAIAMRV